MAYYHCAQIARKDSTMQSFNLHTSIHFGADALSRLASLQYNKAFIIADPFVVSSGLIKMVTKHLETAKIPYTIYSDVAPDPSVEAVSRGVAALMREKAPCIITVGGGSAIDLTKCVRQFANKIEPGYFPYFIAIPTTSGTGSEVTSFAVITDTEKNVKHAIVDQKLLPEEAILDVEMVKSVPASITADTGMDVLTHAIEAYVSTNATSFSDLYAKKATQVCKDYLFRSYNYESTRDVLPRERMHFASNLAGMAFNAASLGLNHGMAHQLGAQFHIPHGKANAILLPTVISYNTGIESHTMSIVNPAPCVHKYAKLARYIGVGSYNDIASVKSFINYIDELRIQMNVPRSIREAAPTITKTEYMNKIEYMAEAAINDRCTPTNPRVPKKQEVMDLFEKIF